MMTSVSGTRGIGKTFHLADEVYKHRLKNFLCITNFTHLLSHINLAKEDPSVLVELIRELGEFKMMGYELCDLSPTFTHTGIFIAIDEAHLFFGADQYKRYASDENFQFVIQFLAQARKQDVEIWYSTQDPSKIDVNFRRYTETWKLYRPVVPLRKLIMVQHPKRPIMQRQMRYIIPLVWEEDHDIDYMQPRFNHRRVRDEYGITQWSKDATIISRRMRRSGWMKRFIYKLYDSYELIGKPPRDHSKFPVLLKNFSYVDPYTIRPEPFPTFKKWLHMKRWDEIIPKRYFFGSTLNLEPLKVENAPTLIQPQEFVDHLKFFNSKARRGFKR